MRILADIVSNEILQVEKNPPDGELVAHNGRYSLPVPEGVSVKVRPSSIVLPSNDPNSVVQQSYAGLLAQIPLFDNIVFNPLIEATDIDDIDPAGVLNEGMPATAFASRNQLGRGTGGPLPAGTVPNSVALLPQNDTVAPSRPGVIVTNTIDIGPLTGGMGSADFAVYWYFYEFSTSVDTRATVGSFAGQNLPAIRNIVEVDQEPSDLEVFLSINDGANFFPVQRLILISFCTTGTQIKIAFKNTNPTTRKYLAGYALLF